MQKPIIQISILVLLLFTILTIHFAHASTIQDPAADIQQTQANLAAQSAQSAKINAMRQAQCPALLKADGVNDPFTSTLRCNLLFSLAHPELFGSAYINAHVIELTSTTNTMYLEFPSGEVKFSYAQLKALSNLSATQISSLGNR